MCERLRSDPKSRALYIERAETTEAELNLTDLCGAIEDLGERDTFPFEERTFLRSAIKGIVGGDTEPRPGGDVNPATRTVTLMPGQRKQIALRMDDDFRGKFAVKALNPTTLAAYSNLALETDYTE